LLPRILFEKYIYILALEMASSVNQHCAFGTLSFPIVRKKTVISGKASVHGSIEITTQNLKLLKLLENIHVIIFNQAAHSIFTPIMGYCGNFSRSLLPFVSAVLQPKTFSFARFDNPY